MAIRLIDVEEAPVATESPFFNTKEAAAYLRITRPTLYKKIHTGDIPAGRVGSDGFWRFRKADLDGWLTANGKAERG